MQEANSLFSVRQQDRESLKDDVARFKAAMLEVYNLDEPVTILDTKKGLHTSHFTCSMDKNHSKSYSELLAYMQKYIRADQGTLTR